ncbi:MAG: acyltransferase family protein [Sporichthyaceae bacterium]
MHSGSHGRYVPALDGMRALAVAAVLAFHGGIPWVQGGFLGVDAFFVLSGYLITTLLLTEWQRTGGIALVDFWGRRARRLLPALLLMMMVVTIWAPRLLPPEEVRLLRGDGVAAIFYVANWRMIFKGGDYFSQTAAPSPLQHTWSLGIEEQFYLLWPVLLLAMLAARQPLRRVFVMCLAGAVVSAIALALAYRTAGPVRAYYGTDTRAACLLIGAGLAALLATRGRHAGNIEPGRRRSSIAALAVLAAAATAWAWVHMSGTGSYLYYGGMTAAALAVAVIIAHITIVPDGVTARALSVPPLPALGRISYAVYLWHWPVFIAANAELTGLHGAPLFMLRCLITVGIAILSYVVVEGPIRSRVKLRRRSVALFGSLGAVAAGVALVILTTTAPPVPPGGTDGPVADGIDQVSPQPTGPGSVDAGSPRSSPSALTRHRRPGAPVIVDVFGDSIAWSLVAYLPRHPGFDVRDRTLLGCGVTRTAPYRYFGTTYPRLKSKCQRWPRLWEGAIASDNPDVAFILVGRWETMNRVLKGRWTHVGDPKFDALLRLELERAIRVAGSQGARVVVATEPYNRRGEQLDGSLFPEDQPQRVTDWNRVLRSVAAAHPNVRVVEFCARVSPGGQFTMTAGGVRVRTDGVHLTPEGVKSWIAPWLVPQLLAAAPT